ncbi:MAG TPA: DinB family protein [Acidimicrobiales bacterium]|nr:DinB family protein [Acidimicrobiales bacterium]
MPTDTALAGGDWFRIVEGTCRQCGLTASQIDRYDLAGAVGAECERWVVLLVEHLQTPDLRSRPDATTWSALEYAAHVRDVLAVFADRVELTLAEDGPEFGWWDHEAAAVAERYNDQDPELVALVLLARARRLAALLGSVEPRQWGREGTRRGTERFTVDGLGRFALHETRHHRLDAERSLARASGS